MNALKKEKLKPEEIRIFKNILVGMFGIWRTDLTVKKRVNLALKFTKQKYIQPKYSCELEQMKLIPPLFY